MIWANPTLSDLCFLQACVFLCPVPKLTYGHFVSLATISSMQGKARIPNSEPTKPAKLVYNIRYVLHGCVWSSNFPLFCLLHHVIRCIQSKRTVFIITGYPPLPCSSKPHPGGIASTRDTSSLYRLRASLVYLTSFFSLLLNREGKISAACHRFVQIVVEVILILIKLVAMQFVWNVGPCSKTTLSCPRFSFKKIVSEVQVLLDSSSQPKVGKLPFKNILANSRYFIHLNLDSEENCKCKWTYIFYRRHVDVDLLASL